MTQRACGFAFMLTMGAVLWVAGELSCLKPYRWYLLRTYWREIAALLLLTWGNLAVWLLLATRRLRRAATGSKVEAVGKDLVTGLERHELGN